MPIATECPNCSYKGSVPDQYKGRKVKCPWCEQLFTVGAAKASNTPPPNAPAKADDKPASGEQPAPPSGPRSTPAVNLPPAAQPRSTPSVSLPATPGPKSVPAVNLPPAPTAKSSPSVSLPATPKPKTVPSMNLTPPAKPRAAASNANPFAALDADAAGTDPTTDGTSHRAAKKAASKAAAAILSLGLLAVLAGLAGVAIPLVIENELLVKLALALGGVGILLGVGGVLFGLFKQAPIGFPIFGAVVSALALVVAGAVQFEYFKPSSIFGDSVADNSDKGKDASSKDGSSKEGGPKDGPGKDGPAKDSNKPTPPAVVEWVDASNKNPVTLGTVQVRVLAATIDVVKGKNLDPAHEKEKLLQIQVEVENTDAARKAEFRGWGSAAPMAAALLTDDAQPPHPLKRVAFGANAQVAGQFVTGPLEAKKPLTDLLVFEPPVEPANSLLLELPAGNFGGQGKLRLKIPTSMITTVTPPPPPDDPRLIAELKSSLKNPDTEARKAAALKLGTFGAKAEVAVPDLLAGLKDSDNKLRVACATSLGQIVPRTPATKMAIPGLVAALKDNAPEVRAAACTALGQIGPEAATTAFAGLLEALTLDEDNAVKDAAAIALKRVKPK